VLGGRRPRSGIDRLTAHLVVVAALLVALNVLARWLAYQREKASPGIAPPEWLAFLDVNSEANLPTWFTVAVMVAAGSAALAVAAVCSGTSQRATWFFVGLGTVLLGLSLDELASVHERLQELGETLTGGSALHFAWAVPGAVVASVLVAGLLVGARPVGGRIRRRLAVALAVFLTGALVVEVAGGQVLRVYGHREAYVLVTAVEEFLEIVGVVLGLRAVLGAVSVRPGPGGWMLTPDLPG